MTEPHGSILKTVAENPGIIEKVLFQKLAMEKFNLKDGIVPDNLADEVLKFKDDFFKEISVMVGKELTQTSTENINKYYIKEHPTIEQSEEILIHPAGGVYKDFVIEPIGDLQYIWKQTDKKGISTAEPVFDDEKHKKRLLFWCIDVNGTIYKFNDRPLKKMIYSIPPRQMIDDWINNNCISRSATEIYNDQDKLIRVCLELPLEHYYNVANLIILESWLTELLDVVFYGQIVGGFGGGKTVALEVLEKCSRHAQMAGNISSASLSRTVAKQKISLFVDELDVKSPETDSETYMNIRQGYRRDNPYIRLNPNTMETELFETFGAKVFTLKSDIEKALKNRSLVINIGEADDFRLPVIDIEKSLLLKKIYYDWFFWYMDNINSIIIKQIDTTQLDLSKSVEELREQIYQIATQKFTDQEKDFLKEFRGRNVELGYIALTIAKAYGLDILDNIRQTFNEKQNTEVEDEIGTYLAVLKELLKKKYEIAQTDKEGIKWVIQSEIFSQFKQTIMEDTKRSVSGYTFAGLLRDVGFIDRVSKKKKSVNGKSTPCLFFDARVLRRLGMSDVTNVKEFIEEDVDKVDGLDKFIEPTQEKEVDRVDRLDKVDMDNNAKQEDTSWGSD